MERFSQPACEILLPGALAVDGLFELSSSTDAVGERGGPLATPQRRDRSRRDNPAQSLRVAGYQKIGPLRMSRNALVAALVGRSAVMAAPRHEGEDPASGT